MMIYVWAMEQRHRHFEKQDVFVPWNSALCARLFSTSNKAEWENDFAHSVKSQTEYPQQLMDSQCSYSVTFDRKHPPKSEGCLAGACCMKLSEEEENHFYRALGRSFRSWFSSRSLDESVLRKPYESVEPLKNTTDTVSVQPSRHCSLDLDCRGPLRKEQRLDVCDEVFVKHAGCKKPEWLTASRPLRNFHREPPTLVQCNNGETSFFSTPVENINSGYIQQLNGHTLESKHFTATPSAGCRGSVSNARLAVGDQAAPGQDTKALMRYYHVFREGELGSLLEESVPEVQILSSSYDHGNWCIIVEKTDLDQQPSL